MSLPMCINFDDKDYTYMITTKGITKETSSIQINLNGMEYKLVSNAKGTGILLMRLLTIILVYLKR